jgi:hypothetical protein|tara:strand:+ start:211 stop:396 length:186 start_codon:yes stop_codon:yes gene_type:complete
MNRKLTYHLKDFKNTVPKQNEDIIKAIDLLLFYIDMRTAVEDYPDSGFTDSFSSLETRKLK